MMIINITAVADPAAIGIDLNKISAASPLKLPVAAKTAHLRCLRSITSVLGVRGYFFRRGLAAGRVGQEISPLASRTRPHSRFTQVGGGSGGQNVARRPH
jgi:hypothetical protein